MKWVLSVPLFIILSCNSPDKGGIYKIMTVNGTIETVSMGITLEHEHVVVDFIGAEKVSQPQYHLNDALDSLLPYFVRLKSKGVETLIDCTPKFIGRDVRLLRAISEQSGLNILTNTGYYAAAGKKFLPAHAYDNAAEKLAEKWIDEWENGIDETGIKPGFIKLGVGRDRLDSIEQKIVRAGAMTHLKTGLKIAIHTGSFMAARDEVEILRTVGVAPDALIVVHAQNMSIEEQIQIAKTGAWISLDGINATPSSQEKYLNFLLVLKKKNLINKTLISQDAYWSVVQTENGDIGFKRYGSPYSAIFDQLIPRLKENGFSDNDIDQLLMKNPAKAYRIEVCRLD
ncbi:MAG: phosphotriesterase [Cytophagales bacterium]|nr:phosphotriesterase [Cytophagales bacterium]